MLIGKGGSTILAMEKESQARIRLLSEPDAETGERIVLLRGEEDAVDRAQALIEERLSEAAEREARGGKGRGGKKLKRRRPDRARPAAVEMVPEFDAATGQLKVVERRVEASEAAGGRGGGSESDGEEALSTRRPKRVQRFDKGSGERTKYFRDDDAGASLSSLYEEARRGAGKTIDDHYADNVARAGRKYKGPASADDEYDNDGGVEMHESRLSRKSDAKRKQAEASQQAAAERRQGALEQTAERRFNERKHLVVALGEHVYLRLQDKAPIGLGHCVIEPIEHVPSHVEAAEEVATEARNFQKCLVRMFAARGAQLVFLEQHLRLGSAGLPSRDTMAIECIPLPARDAAAAPGYFKKAILECDEEWSQHKKIYDTGGCVRGTVPAGFSYFAVSFALQAGYAHVVENEAEWNTDFGRETVEGLIEFDGAGIPLKRRPPLPFEEMRSRVVDFGKAFEPYDWTQQLS